MKKAAPRSEPRQARLERKILELERTVQLLEEARSHYADRSVTLNDHEARDVLMAVELIQLEGRQCLLTIGQDVTDLKRLQREVVEISQREQPRIGQDLHDGPCRSFNGMAILGEVVARDLDGAHSLLAGRVRDISRMGSDCRKNWGRRTASACTPCNTVRA